MTQQHVVSIKQIAQYEGQDITIKGWLRHPPFKRKAEFFDGA